MINISGNKDSVLDEIFIRFEKSVLSKEICEMGAIDGDTIEFIVNAQGFPVWIQSTGDGYDTTAVLTTRITNAGASRVVTVDLHAGQIQGFFDMPVDNLFTTPLFSKFIKKKISSKNLICVSPDMGGVARTRALATRIKADLAIIDKRRPAPGKSEVMNIIGDVKNKTCIIVDDIIDSGGTIVNAVEALKKNGANEVYVFITHAVLSGDAVKKIKNSKIKKLVITDTIDNAQKIKNNNKIEVLSIASLMSEAIKRIANSNSVSDLFN